MYEHTVQIKGEDGKWEAIGTYYDSKMAKARANGLRKRHGDDNVRVVKHDAPW